MSKCHVHTTVTVEVRRAPILPLLIQFNVVLGLALGLLWLIYPEGFR